MSDRKTRYSPEEAQRIFRTIQERHAAGEEVPKICKDLDFKVSTYYNWFAKFKKQGQLPTPRHSTKAKAPTLQTIVMQPQQDNQLLVLMGNARDVNQALDTLARIRG
jgi:transposase-like protein